MYTGRIKTILKRSQFLSVRQAALTLGVDRLVTLLNSKQFEEQILSNKSFIFHNKTQRKQKSLQILNDINQNRLTTVNSNFFLHKC